MNFKNQNRFLKYLKNRKWINNIFYCKIFPWGNTALEAQLESEHEGRTLLVREKHELERQLLSVVQQAAIAMDDDTIMKLKRDLKRTKALLKDAQTQVERARSETPSKVLLRQLKNQVRLSLMDI